MSLTVDGVWKAGVWATTVWADGVWREGAASAQDVGVIYDLLAQREKANRKKKREFELKIEQTLTEVLEGPQTEEVQEVVRQFVPRKLKKKLPESGRIPPQYVDYSRLIRDMGSLQDLLLRLPGQYQQTIEDLYAQEAIEILLLSDI